MINLTKDIKKAKEVAKILYYKFNSKEGIFGHNTMPEDKATTMGHIKREHLSESIKLLTIK